MFHGLVVKELPVAVQSRQGRAGYRVGRSGSDMDRGRHLAGGWSTVQSTSHFRRRHGGRSTSMKLRFWEFKGLNSKKLEGEIPSQKIRFFFCSCRCSQGEPLLPILYLSQLKSLALFSPSFSASPSSLPPPCVSSRKTRHSCWSRRQCSFVDAQTSPHPSGRLHSGPTLQTKGRPVRLPLLPPLRPPLP